MGAVHTYAYPRPSSFSLERGLELRTSGGTAPAPRLFRGFFPPASAAALLAVANVARTRYLDPSATRYRDPVLTCDGRRLRLEALSDCGGLYVRLDLLQEGLDGEVLGRGVVHADIGDALRRTLATITDRRPLRVTVGGEAPPGAPGAAPAGRTVPLPEQWLRGFAEVQVVSAGFDPRVRLGAGDAARLLRALPAPSRADGPLWLSPTGGSLHPVAQPSPGAVCLPGPQRLAPLRPVLPFLTGLRVYGPAVAAGAPHAASAWEFGLPGMRLTAVLSPELAGGFSADVPEPDAPGAAAAVDDADLVAASLHLDPRIDVDLLAARCGLDVVRVRRALVRLGTSGRVGHDLAEAAYFHRELPYDLDAVERLNPRLAAARALVAAGAVRVEAAQGGAVAVQVTVNGRQHQVGGQGGHLTCTCPRYAGHDAGDGAGGGAGGGAGRGSCLHVLAAELSTRPAARAAAARLSA